ncbi:ABC-type glycerol-3-phosphate transport system substrate-binding protein [Arthrobacter pigmenti]|uniref:ABC-type glycerol-3-phosphate transport system substrate-binding protein n=1 Tax=Arthrobacter pigmenti TaxID=271432 RepID=A0A846RQ34_9MICC|nr:extracellular solute-binding protein [Arthrobacter pigmenti]NJC22692.1 ABC-type glycerol-3-phosphate transport system substrate-binding protein [Arthrobacter pigmenti]
MRKTVPSTLGAVAVVGLLSGCAFGGGSTEGGGDAPADGPVALTFQSLAFQGPTVEATEEIVASWNEANPDIQVELRQGSWDNVQAQLVTQFEGGTAPDIIHFESAGMAGFAEQGYLADLEPYIGEDLRSSVSEDLWSTVTSEEAGTYAVPTLLQSYVVFANNDAFEAAGVPLPDGETLPWDDFQQVASDLTGDGTFGVGWGLRQPTATIMNMAPMFGGEFFQVDGENVTIEVGEEELAAPQRIHQMAFEDGSIDPVSLTQSGSDVLPGFYGGTYAMYVGGNFIAQQLIESAPEGFNWSILPPLEGTVSAEQVANPQTMSVAAESESPEAAAQFIEYFMAQENLAQLAQGDWLIPATSTARELVAEQTDGENGWAATLATGELLTSAPFQQVTSYNQWKDQYATPIFQQYFADSISYEELQTQLSEGWESAGG